MSIRDLFEGCGRFCVSVGDEQDHICQDWSAGWCGQFPADQGSQWSVERMVSQSELPHDFSDQDHPSDQQREDGPCCLICSSLYLYLACLLEWFWNIKLLYKYTRCKADKCNGWESIVLKLWVYPINGVIDWKNILCYNFTVELSLDQRNVNFHNLCIKPPRPDIIVE